MNEGFSNKSKIETEVETSEGKEAFLHLDVSEVMKAYNAYFLHTIQITNALDVSENNQAVDTKDLTVSDKLDILYAANPSISTSTVRPNTLDGTFHGGFGVVVSGGEITSAHPSDNGSIALSVGERVAVGGDNHEPEDIERAVNRTHPDTVHKSYNEVAVRSAEVAGGFMKLQSDSHVTYEDMDRDYGSGGGVVKETVGRLDLGTIYETDSSGNPDLKRWKKRFDSAFNTLREMEIRGPVFILDEQNQLFRVTDIDVTTRIVSFSPTPFTPSDVADIFGNQNISQERRRELLENLQSEGVVLK